MIKPAVEEEMAIEEVKDEGVKNIKSVMAEVMAAVNDLKTKCDALNENYSKMKEQFESFKKEPKAEPIKRNAVVEPYRFGSGEHQSVRMIESLRNRN
jgi:phage shock protein A